MKPIVKPEVFTSKDIYWRYVEKLLSENPDWYTRFSKKLRMKHAVVWGPNEKGNPEIKMSWTIWKDVIEVYFHKAKGKIIQGQALRIGGSLGILRMCRVERNFKVKAINWNATYKLNKKDPVTGKKKLVYYTDEDYCRVEWSKNPAMQNIRDYRFSPAAKNTREKTGFKHEIAVALVINPRLKYRYKFYPLKNIQRNGV